MEFKAARQGITLILLSAMVEAVGFIGLNVAELEELPVAESLLLAGLGLALLAGILQVVGVVRAAKADRVFLDALWILLFMIIITVMTAVLPSLGVDFSYSSYLMIVFEAMAVVSILHGVVALFRKRGDEAMAKRGSRTVTLYTVAVLMDLAANFFGEKIARDTTAIEIGVIAGGIISVILDIAAYVCYLLYLNKARKALREA